MSRSSIVTDQNNSSTRGQFQSITVWAQRERERAGRITNTQIGMTERKRDMMIGVICTSSKSMGLKLFTLFIPSPSSIIVVLADTVATLSAAGMAPFVLVWQDRLCGQ